MKSRVSIIILAALLFTSHEVLAQKSSFLANMTNREVVADGNDGSRDLNAIVAAYTSRLDSKAFPGGEETPPSNPYFARRQVTSCNTCHVAVPKLNTYGRLVKNIGYELPELDLSGHEEFALKKMSRYIPFAFRGIVDLAQLVQRRHARVGVAGIDRKRGYLA